MTVYGNVLGKTWLKEHWPEHVHLRTRDEITAARKSLKEADQNNARDTSRRDGNRSGYTRGGRGRGHNERRGSRGSLRRSRSPDDRSRYGQRDRSPNIPRVPLVEQDTIDPSVNPAVYLLQQHLRKKVEKKSAAGASTGDGDAVKTEDLSTVEQQPGQLDGMQRALDLVQARLDATMSELVDAKKRVTSLRGEKNHLQTEKDSLSKRLIQSEVEKKELLTSHAAEIEQMRIKYTAKISELQKSNQHAVNQYGHQSLEIVNVRKDLDDLRERCQGIETENSRLTDENTKLRQEVGQAQVTQARVRESEGPLQAARSASRPMPASVQESAASRSRTGMDDVQNVKVKEEE
ncbi:hypothetical protein N0V94_006702 [Neodidymelliopsis sp. IMI 364377]|nr:hypothetical protein N0V94_006702 [Neodidymelliopsis sp. IMI 364377]